jgi:hypothetical protein
MTFIFILNAKFWQFSTLSRDIQWNLTKPDELPGITNYRCANIHTSINTFNTFPPGRPFNLLPICKHTVDWSDHDRFTEINYKSN